MTPGFFWCPRPETTAEEMTPGRKPDSRPVSAPPWPWPICNRTIPLSYSSQLPTDIRGYGVTAPGTDITQFVPYPYLVGDYTLLPEGVTASGTSLAAPHATATAGLILSEAYDLGLAIPDRGPERVEWLREVIITTTLDLGEPGPDSIYGYGLIRAENALRYLQTLQ